MSAGDVVDVVDTHPHVIATETERYPFAPIGGVRSGWSSERSNTTEQFVLYMDDAGVRQAALVQASTAYGYDNNYCADSVSKYPERFVGVCCVDAAAEDGAEQLRYWVQERGMSGVRLFTAGSTLNETDWLDREGARPFWLEATRLGASVCVNMRRTGLPMLVNVLTRHPNVRIVLDHLGNPFVEDGPPYVEADSLFDLARYPNLWLKFSNHNLHDAARGKSTVKEFFGKLVDAFGANRLMWGSNFPATWGTGPAGPYKSLVDEAREKLKVVGGEENQRWMLAGTARSVYPKLAAVAAR